MAERQPGVAADCVLSLLRREDFRDDDEEVRVYTAALLMADAYQELRGCRQILEAIAKGLAG
jgi:hypothetical protein